MIIRFVLFAYSFIGTSENGNKEKCFVSNTTELKNIKIGPSTL
jgi:hypothetical protein